MRVFRQILKQIPKHDALDIVDLWARENKFNDIIPYTAPKTVSQSAQTEKQNYKNAKINTNEVKINISEVMVISVIEKSC